jgi:hypothetical protein
MENEEIGIRLILKTPAKPPPGFLLPKTKARKY